MFTGSSTTNMHSTLRLVGPSNDLYADNWVVLRFGVLVRPFVGEGTLGMREGKSTMSNSLSSLQVPEGICSEC